MNRQEKYREVRKRKRGKVKGVREDRESKDRYVLGEREGGARVQGKDVGEGKGNIHAH